MADDNYYASMGQGPTVVAPGDDEAPVVSAPVTGNPWDAPSVTGNPWDAPTTYAADPVATGYGVQDPGLDMEMAAMKNNQFQGEDVKAALIRELNTSDGEELEKHQKEVEVYKEQMYHKEIGHDERNPRKRRNFCACWSKVKYSAVEHPLMTIQIFNLLNVLTLVTLWWVLLGSHSKELEEFKMYFPEQWNFVRRNFIYYYTSIGWWTFCIIVDFISEDEENPVILCVTLTGGLWYIALIFISFFQLTTVYDRVYMDAIQGRFQEFQPIASIINAMIQARFGALYLPCCLVCCTALFKCCSLVSDNDDDYEQQRDDYIQKPIAGKSNLITRRLNFLSSHIHTFDYQADHDEVCAICQEPYDADLSKKICELDCSNNHIFHTKCLTDWMKREEEEGKKPDCPICRAPINLPNFMESTVSN